MGGFFGRNFRSWLLQNWLNSLADEGFQQNFRRFFLCFFLPGESETGDRSYKNPSRLMWDVGCGVKIIFETNKVDSFK